SPEESAQLGAEKINQLGMELAQAIAPDHQIAVYTHVDKEHFHNHIVINSVNLETGNKYHQYKEFNHVKGLNDKILKQHHLEIVQPQKHYEKLTSEEIQIKRREGTPWKDEVRRKIDEVMQDRSVSSYEAFRERLEERGIKVHERGQNVTYELLEDNKKVRGNKLGSSYERETIQQELVSRDLAK
ncbi:relaxase/mobilization nuclease domain-containing protein, partial [Enterococcus gallinarum]